MSFNVRQLENELGVTLLLRSTRRLTLTEAGSLFYHRGVALLKAAENLQDDVRDSHVGLSGKLRITTTPEYGAQVIIPALAEFSFPPQGVYAVYPDAQHIPARVRAFIDFYANAWVNAAVLALSACG